MNIIQRLKDGANRATEKAQGTLEISKLNSQIADIEKEMGGYFKEMGKVFYDGYRSEDMTEAETEMMELSKDCDRLQTEIDELRWRIAGLKNERLCTCGHVATLEANFCPSCGRKLADEPFQKQSEPVKVKNERPAEPVYKYPDEYMNHEEEAGAAVEPEHEYDRAEVWEELPDTPTTDTEWDQRHADELERERERQLELDRRIRYWKENNGNSDPSAENEGVRDTVKCQICRADLPKGSKWCPRCGAEQI